jgi:hypothetical protein
LSSSSARWKCRRAAILQPAVKKVRAIPRPGFSQPVAASAHRVGRDIDGGKAAEM